MSDVGCGGGRAVGAESVASDTVIDRHKARTLGFLKWLQGWEVPPVGEATGDETAGWGSWELVVRGPGREGGGCHGNSSAGSQT